MSRSEKDVKKEALHGFRITDPDVNRAFEERIRQLKKKGLDNNQDLTKTDIILFGLQHGLKVNLRAKDIKTESLGRKRE